MDSIAYNVVILPSKTLADKAIETSNQLAPNGVLFTLADRAFYPHASVYMLQLKTADLLVVEEKLREIAANTSKLSLTAQKYTQAKQFLDAEYEKPSELSKLQDDVVAALNSLRDGMRAKDVERMKEATGLALENLKNYGWSTIGELYRPHLTLTRFTEDQDIESLILPDIKAFTGAFEKLGLFEMGDNGTCVRKIAEFELGM